MCYVSGTNINAKTRNEHPLGSERRKYSVTLAEPVSRCNCGVHKICSVEAVNLIASHIHGSCGLCRNIRQTELNTGVRSRGLFVIWWRSQLEWSIPGGLIRWGFKKSICGNALLNTGSCLTFRQAPKSHSMPILSMQPGEDKFVSA